MSETVHSPAAMATATLEGDGRRAAGAATDAALMTRVQGGDRDAFAELVDRHRDGLVAYLTRMCGDPGTAQDLAQEAFLRLYRAAGRYREQGHLQAYLYRIASNVHRSRERGERRFAWIPFDGRRHGARDDATPQEATLRDETARRVCRAIRDLPWTHRAALVLHAIEGWPIARIARTLDCREGTVKSRISRARATLRHTLEADLPGGVT